VGAPPPFRQGAEAEQVQAWKEDALVSPLIRLAVRSAFVGSAAGAALLQSNLPGVSLEELVEALIATYIAALTYSGVAPYTGLEPRIGVKPAAKK
jgi:hypothetical protein